MNDNYLYEYAFLFERVLSYAYRNNYSLSALERNISYSKTFLSIESNGNDLGPTIDEEALIRSLFPGVITPIEDIPEYSQCLWAAESYLRIQRQTHLTFEAIFLYIPIKEMYGFFPLYHEMDFSRIVERFQELHEERSVLSLLLEKYEYDAKTVSRITGIPYDTLQSLKNRRRDISKVAIEKAFALSSLFQIRIETMTELNVSINDFPV